MEYRLIDHSVHEILQLSEEADDTPFPYEGCRRLLAETGNKYKDYRDLIPYLDLYFYNISSYSSVAQKIIHWSPEKLLDAKDKLDGSFFDNHPRYKLFAPMITREFVPDLYRELAIHEQIRHLLLDVISEQLREQGCPSRVYPIDGFLSSLGCGMGWLAVPTEDYEQAALTAGLTDCKKAPYREGVRFINKSRDFGFVTPPYEGWVLVFGLWLLPELSSGDFNPADLVPIQDIVRVLSSKFGEAQAFASSTGIPLFHWIKATRGVLTRSFVYSDYDEKIVMDTGERTDAELRLEAITSSTSSVTMADNVLTVARGWSVDPVVACSSLSEGECIVGTAPLP